MGIFKTNGGGLKRHIRQLFILFAEQLHLAHMILGLQSVSSLDFRRDTCLSKRLTLQQQHDIT